MTTRAKKDQPQPQAPSKPEPPAPAPEPEVKPEEKATEPVPSEVKEQAEKPEQTEASDAASLPMGELPPDFNDDPWGVQGPIGNDGDIGTAGNRPRREKPPAQPQPRPEMSVNLNPPHDPSQKEGAQVPQPVNVAAQQPPAVDEVPMSPSLVHIDETGAVLLSRENEKLFLIPEMVELVMPWLGGSELANFRILPESGQVSCVTWPDGRSKKFSVKV